MVIGVLADHKSIFSLGQAAFKTWYQDVSKIADVYFVIGECTYPPEMKDAVLCLDTPDVYPPQVKEFKLWQHFARYPKGKYDFFLKTDLDTYLDAAKLHDLLYSQLKSSIGQPGYMGFAAKGRAEERKVLGLTQPYCLGYGYILTEPTVAELAESAGRCVQSFVSLHSDTEVCALLSFNVF